METMFVVPAGVELKLVHQDARREIWEWENGKIAISRIVTSQEGEEPLVLGNHRHDDKHEVFRVVNGRGVYIMQATKDGELIGEPTIRKVVMDDVMVVPIGFAHTLICEPGFDLECFSTAPFNGDAMKHHMLVDPKNDDVIKGLMQDHLGS